MGKVNDRSDGKSLSFCLPSFAHYVCVCMCVYACQCYKYEEIFIFISVYVTVTTRNSSFFHERFLQSHFFYFILFLMYMINTHEKKMLKQIQSIKLQNFTIYFCSVPHCASKHIFSMIRVCRVEFGGLKKHFFCCCCCSDVVVKA